MRVRAKLIWACGVLLFFPRTSLGETLFPIKWDTVLNAPYSAVQETEEVRTLGNGVHTVFKGRSRFYRDSQGRTRHESLAPTRPGDLLELQSITIMDPVARASYVLFVKTRTGIREISKPAPPPVAPRPGTWTGEGYVDAPLPDRFGITQSIPQDPAQPQTMDELLGTQSMEGLFVEGRKRTITYPIGSKGNTEPFSTVQEEWYSKDLNITVLSKYSDPRSESRVVRMTDITRSEPDPLLFQVPAGYTIQDQAEVLGRTASGPLIVRAAGPGYPFGTNLVLNAPYSATYEDLQASNGKIPAASNIPIRLYRDSNGRVRVEHLSHLRQGGPLEVTSVEIDDRMGGVHYSLNPRDHTGRRKLLKLIAPDTVGGRGAVSGAYTGVRAGTTSAGAGSKPQDPLRPQVTSESLGTRIMEGLVVEGRRSTTTFPTGSAGNDGPFSTVEEEWSSNELKMVIFRKSSDPRTGDHITRITDISRSEPEPLLFQVPSDYTIKDQTDAFPLPLLR